MKNEKTKYYLCFLNGLIYKQIESDSARIFFRDIETKQWRHSPHWGNFGYIQYFRELLEEEAAILV